MKFLNIATIVYLHIIICLKKKTMDLLKKTMDIKICKTFNPTWKIHHIYAYIYTNLH